MRSTLLALWLAGSADLGTEVRDTAYWCAQLRYLGCSTRGAAVLLALRHNLVPDAGKSSGGLYARDVGWFR
jgi:hypothetical protein